MRANRQIRRRTRGAWKTAELWQFRAPQQCEIVSMGGEEIDEGFEVQGFERSVATPILKGVPRLRSVQDENHAVGVLKIIVPFKVGRE